MAYEDLHVGLLTNTRSLFIGKRVTQPNGDEKWSTHSSSRTKEIIETVMEKMKMDVRHVGNPDKPYAGYHMPGVGTLLFIDEGYTFSIRPAASKK